MLTSYYQAKLSSAQLASVHDTRYHSAKGHFSSTPGIIVTEAQTATKAIIRSPTAPEPISPLTHSAYSPSPTFLWRHAYKALYPR